MFSIRRPATTIQNAMQKHLTYVKQFFFIERFVQNTAHFDRRGIAVCHSYFHYDLLRRAGRYIPATERF